MNYQFGVSQRPAYRFKLKLGPLTKPEVDCLTALYCYHGQAVAFLWNGSPWNNVENYYVVGEGDGTRTEYFLQNRYVDANSIAVAVVVSGVQSVTTAFTLVATPGIVRFTTAPSSGSTVEARHAHQYKVTFAADLRVAVIRKHLFDAEVELAEIQR